MAVRSGYELGTAPRASASTRALPHARRHLRLYYVGKPPYLWGGYAEHMYLCPHSLMKKMEPGIPAVAVMFNPLAAGLSWAAAVPATGPGDRVVILGAGQRGLCCVIAARAAGARQVVITGLTRDAQKLALARELGADAAHRRRAERGGGERARCDGRRRRGRGRHDAVRAPVAESRDRHRRPQGPHRGGRPQGPAPRPGPGRRFDHLQGADDPRRRSACPSTRPSEPSS